MSCVVRCILRTCLGREDSDDDDERNQNENEELSHSATGGEPSHPTTTAATDDSQTRGLYQSAPTHPAYQDNDDENENDESDDHCCGRHHPGRIFSPRSSQQSNNNATTDDPSGMSQLSFNSRDSNHSNGLQEFWGKLRERLGTYDTVDSDEDGLHSPPPHRRHFNIFRRALSERSAPAVIKPLKKHDPKIPYLKTASTFDGVSHSVPTISQEEIVMPGSKLQAQMALAAAQSLDTMGDECVICMEGFEPTNPRMPTLCGCGENKTYFHLPCLYQWIEQNENCPSCRVPLRWEEF